MRHIKEIGRLKRNVSHGTRSSIGGNKYVKDGLRSVHTSASSVSGKCRITSKSAYEWYRLLK